VSYSTKLRAFPYGTKPNRRIRIPSYEMPTMPLASAGYHGIFYGVSPAVIALILHSCYCLAKLGMDDTSRALARLRP
jgi:hypothetical protein